MLTERTKHRARRLRQLAGILIILCAAYFLAGAILILFNLLRVQLYLQVAGGVGALASVVGLIALARPSVGQEGFEDMEVETLKRLADTAEEVRELEFARSKTEREVNELEIQRREMEALVRKASLSLFLQEQHRLQRERISALIERQSELRKLLEEHRQTTERLSALEEEIEQDPNVEVLQDIISRARGDRPMPRDMSFAAIFARALVQALRFYTGLLKA